MKNLFKIQDNHSKRQIVYKPDSCADTMNHSRGSKGNQEAYNNLWEKFHLKAFAKESCFQVSDSLIAAI